MQCVSAGRPSVVRVIKKKKKKKTELFPLFFFSPSFFLFFFPFDLRGSAHHVGGNKHEEIK